MIEASDGEQAIDVIQRESSGPGSTRSGIASAERSKCNTSLAEGPGIDRGSSGVITGYDNHFDSAVAAGCDDYLLKPIDFDHLDAILDYYVPTRINAMSA